MHIGSVDIKAALGKIVLVGIHSEEEGGWMEKMNRNDGVFEK